MASDAERKKAGAAKRRKRLLVTGLLALIYLVFYVSCYFALRPKAWIVPIAADDFRTIESNYAPPGTTWPSNPYGSHFGALADRFFLPLIWAEETCCKRVVWFELGKWPLIYF